jgi:hypothetical protein
MPKISTVAFGYSAIYVSVFNVVRKRERIETTNREDHATVALTTVERSSEQHARRRSNQRLSEQVCSDQYFQNDHRSLPA